MEHLKICPTPTSAVYTKYYCEENVWKLCDHIHKIDPKALKRSWTVFISNHKRCVWLFEQKSAGSAHSPVFWDYHVVMLSVSPEGHPLIYDLDSTLPFPAPLRTYIEKALRIDLKDKWNIPLQTLRIISAEEYLACFSSDRSHMWDEKEKRFRQPPPPYPCLISDKSPNNLQEFINMQAESGFGKVLDVEEFRSVTNGGDDIEFLEPEVKTHKTLETSACCSL